MRFFPSLLVAAALIGAGCSKPAPAPAPAEKQAPRATMSESLGFVSADPDSYTRAEPRAASAPAGASPAPAATTTPARAVAAPTIQRMLTGKDGRQIDAFLLSRTYTAVKIRRVADSMEFVVPLEKLSDADRAFIEGGGVPLAGAR